MPTKKVLYEGKAKQLIKGPNKDTLIQIFKDDATAYNKKKHKIFESKGVTLYIFFIFSTLSRIVHM